MERIEYPKEIKEFFKTVSFIILTPIYERVDYRFIPCLTNLVAHTVQNGCTYKGFCTVHRTKTVGARNRLLEAAMDKTDAKYFVWIDDDHLFNENLLCNLLARQQDYICPIMTQKLPPYYATVYQESKHDKHGYHNYIDWPDGVFEIDASGFGFVVMKREIVSKLTRPYFEEKTGSYGQDLFFCSKLKEKGIKMYCDGSMAVDHISHEAPVVGVKDYGKYKEKIIEENTKALIDKEVLT